MKKGWLVGFLGALGCVVLGDAAGILCQYFEIEGFAGMVSWMVPLAGFGLIVLFHGGSTGENKYGANPRNK